MDVHQGEEQDPNGAPEERSPPRWSGECEQKSAVAMTTLSAPRRCDKPSPRTPKPAREPREPVGVPERLLTGNETPAPAEPSKVEPPLVTPSIWRNSLPMAIDNTAGSTFADSCPPSKPVFTRPLPRVETTTVPPPRFTSGFAVIVLCFSAPNALSAQQPVSAICPSQYHFNVPGTIANFAGFSNFSIVMEPVHQRQAPATGLVGSLNSVTFFL